MGRALLALAGLAVALLLGEALVRWAGVGDATLSRGSLHVQHPRFGWICKPGIDARYVLPGNFDARVVCNAHGQRSPELPLARTPGRTRIAVLGDSFMWGYGVEDDALLSGRLAALVPGAEVVNLAANGYGTVQQVLRFEEEGLPYAPDWTLLAFTWNDLGDNFDDKDGGRPMAVPRADGALEIANLPVRKPWKSSGAQWLRRASRLFSFLDYSRDLIRLELRAWRRERWLRSNPGETPRWKQREEEPLDFSPRELYGEPSPEIDIAWQTVQALLARLDARAREAGGRLLVVANANSEIMQRDAFEARYGRSAALDWDRPGRRLAAICDALGIEYLDLNPVFRREPDPAALFFPSNSHWSPAGHDLAARAVAERLRALSPAPGRADG